MKVEYARGYARTLYERELHDRLLTEVMEADPVAPRLTLEEEHGLEVAHPHPNRVAIRRFGFEQLILG